jgi:hypothetical protein
MRNTLAFVAAGTLTMIGVGWYLGWFSFRSVPADAGHRSWTVDMNTDKISSDLRDAEQKVQKKLAEKSQTTATVPGAESKPKPTPAPVLGTSVGSSTKPDTGARRQPGRTREKLEGEPTGEQPQR